MSQNINITYKIDSSQVASSTAQVEKAKAATDQLNQSAQKLGQTGAKSTINFGNTIEGVKLKMQQLKGQIDLTNQTDTKRLNGLITQYKAAQKQLEGYTSKLKDSNKESQNAAKGGDSLATSFGNVYSAIKLIIGAHIVKQFVNLSIEAASLSGKVEGVERAFNRAFPQAVSLLNDLRKATHGTVTDFELMQRTLQATNLGVGVEQLPVLLEFAAARAQQTGESVDYLVDSIVRGIGRKSLLVLDNLGLSAVRLKEQFNGASLASQSVADVTVGVAKIAKEELAKMGGYVENNETKVNQLKVSWTNLGIEISKLAAGKGGIISYFDGVVGRFKDLFEVINKGITVQELYHDRLVLEAAQEGINIIKQKEFTGEREHDLKITQEIIAEKTHELIQQQEEIKNLQARRTALLQAAKGYAEVKKVSETNAKEQASLKYANEILIEQIKLLKGIAGSMIVKDELDKQNSDTLEILETKVKDLNEQLQNTEGISTKAGISEARRIKEQIIATQTKIDTIKDEIYWEEVLQKRREGAKDIKIATPDKDKVLKDFESLTTAVSQEIPPIKLPAPVVPEDEWDKFSDSFMRHIGDIAQESENILKDQSNAAFQIRVDDLDAEIKATQDFYDTQINLAGDNEKAKQQLRIQEDRKIKELERQRAQREKQAAQASIIVNTALGIIKAIATAATIYDGLVEAAVVAAEGASQYAIASSARYYAKGGINIDGPGTGTSDSIPAFLSKGESVMTAQETSTSERTLRMIRAKKLNDDVLDRIMAKANNSGAVIGFDDTRLLAATKQVARAAAGNDIIHKAGIIYEAKEVGSNMKRYIRSKSLNP